jgi:hypothetical protein
VSGVEEDHRPRDEGGARDRAAARRDVDAAIRDRMATEEMANTEGAARSDAARDRMDAMRDRQAAARDREDAGRPPAGDGDAESPPEAPDDAR